MPSSLVFITGLSMTLGCSTHTEPVTDPVTEPVTEPVPELVPTSNPPPPPLPPPDPVPIRTSNPPMPPPMPPAALPTWDDVASSHPEGATNPPAPLLAVSADGERCYKEWRDVRVAPREVLQAGGRVMADGETSNGTEIACPAERRQKVLDANGATGDGSQ